MKININGVEVEGDLQTLRSLLVPNSNPTYQGLLKAIPLIPKITDTDTNINKIGKSLRKRSYLKSGVILSRSDSILAQDVLVDMCKNVGVDKIIINTGLSKAVVTNRFKYPENYKGRMATPVFLAIENACKNLYGKSVSEYFSE